MCLVANFTGNYELKYVIIKALQQQGFSACRKTFGTLLDFEKGSYIFRSYNRRRTKVRQSVRTEKASKHKAFSMFALCFFFCVSNFLFIAFYLLKFHSCGRAAFSTVCNGSSKELPLFTY